MNIGKLNLKSSIKSQSKFHHGALEDSRTCGKIVNLAAEKWGVSSVEDILSECELKLLELQRRLNAPSGRLDE